VRRTLAAVLCACCVALAGACGGSSDDGASEAATTEAPAPSPTAPAGDLAGHLPPEDAVEDLGAAALRELPTAQAFVEAFYQRDDPTRDDTQRRLVAGGYAEGLLRDQLGEDPENGAAVVRSYVIRMRDAAAARQEVAAALAEVARTTPGETTEIDLEGVEGGGGVRLELAEGDATGSAVFVAFPAGPYVHGIQAASRSGADLPEDEVVQAAQDLAARVGSAP
jgi:hypothetical protein